MYGIVDLPAFTIIYWLKTCRQIYSNIPYMDPVGPYM